MNKYTGITFQNIAQAAAKAAAILATMAAFASAFVFFS